LERHEQSYRRIGAERSARVNLNLLEPDEIRSKRYENDEKFAGLCASIEDFTQVAPLLVIETKGGKYKIVDGNRRYKALKEKGIEGKT
jgi:ParB/RepB/Spo0J family partition protein